MPWIIPPLRNYIYSDVDELIFRDEEPYISQR